ncbi:hypothetical protein AC062_1138 [Pasteurellaceae bacterium NI1060]|nr:hypothetical protein AC062_1138 [Pasteurellaceae bacterium NI1060]
MKKIPNEKGNATVEGDSTVKEMLPLRKILLLKEMQRLMVIAL